MGVSFTAICQVPSTLHWLANSIYLFMPKISIQCLLNGGTDSDLGWRYGKNTAGKVPNLMEFRFLRQSCSIELSVMMDMFITGLCDKVAISHMC